MAHDVTIEIPAGSRVKYEFDHETGRLRLDRVLFTSMQYPTHYGYFENTLGEDGDPLDALVYLPGFDLVPGCVVEARPVGVFNMTDDGGGDAKLLCVPADKRYDHITELEHVEESLKQEIEHFFTRYKDLEPGKWVKAEGWEGRAALPALGLDPLARLEVLVAGEEVLDLLLEGLLHVLELGDVVVALVRRDAQQLGVAAAVVGHVEHADRAGLDDAARHQVEARQVHEGVQRVAVLAEGVLEVAVVRGVLHGGEEHAVQAQAAGLVVELVLHAGARGDLDGDVVRHDSPSHRGWGVRAARRRPAVLPSAYRGRPS